MNDDVEQIHDSSAPSSPSRLNRRQLLVSGSVAGFSLLGGRLLANPMLSSERARSGDTDTNIINAAATAEALATTMYYNIITAPGSIYQVGLAGNAPDQAYLVAGYEQELNHYKFLVGEGASPLATTFYFPENMFVDPQTTVNVLVTLEDAFIAAYLIGVHDLTTNWLRTVAAQIGGVEAEHRVLARVVTNDLGLTSVTGLSGVAESVAAPNYTANNLAYERTFTPALPDITHVVDALLPFVSPGAAGFSTTPYKFSTAANAAPSAGQPFVTLADSKPYSTPSHP